MGKAFEKQTKTIKEQGKQQFKAFKRNNTNANFYEDELLISKQIKIFKNIYKERLEKIEELTEKDDYDDLKFIDQSSGNFTDFTRIKYPLDLLDDIRTNKITLEKAKHLQKVFNEYLKIIRVGNKSVEQKKRWQLLISFLMEEYSSMILEAKKQATKGTGLKILTPKQMLHRSPTALAQVKAGNNSESLLNEIRQIVYSLYQSKEITKKIYNNTIKSIKNGYYIYEL